MNKNIGILCTDKITLYQIRTYPSNTYIIYYFDVLKNTLEDAINFLISNDCFDIYISSDEIKYNIEWIKKKFIQISFYFNKDEIKSYSSVSKFIFLNLKKDKIKKSNIKDYIDYYKLNTFRKDAPPKETINQIKNILKTNNYKVKEKSIKRNLYGIYSVRLELGYNKGTNGKGISLQHAKASAYAELMERLQSNMLEKRRFSTDSINKNIELYLPLLNKASKTYIKNFFTLDDIYFNTEKLLNIKTNKYEEIPINSVNCFCHTNGLASGNSFNEAISQAIFEILERHCYQTLLNSNRIVKNIDITKYPLNNVNKKNLMKLKKLGYNYYIKDCSIGKFPVLGFLLLNKDLSKYTFTIASDYSLNIALSRCITEMLQGISLKELDKKMLNKIPLEQLAKRYKKNYKSYNWLRCFNNNMGYLTENFFSEEYIDIKLLKFKDYLSSNKEVLSNLKNDIDFNIYVKNFNILGFNTYRVYIPYITSTDCYDIDDLLISKNYKQLYTTYTNIISANINEIRFFVDVFLKLNMNIKYDELIKPCDIFHLNEISDYFKLDCTSLLIVLSLITSQEKELCNLLIYKINNFYLSEIKIITYKIIINILNDKKIYDISNIKIENYIRNIRSNPYKYLLTLNPYYNTATTLLTNKKDSTF